MPHPRSFAPLLALALAACPAATTSTTTSPAHAPADPALSSGASEPSAASTACVGAPVAPPTGAHEVDDPALVARAVGGPGEGKLCAGKAYEVTQPIVVHRVWQSAKAYTLFGGWWSLEAPRGPVGEFRARYEVCPEWSTLDVASTCTLKVGARFVIGPGQSARCADGSTLGASPANQLFVPNDSRAGVVLVEGCEPPTAWP